MFSCMTGSHTAGIRAHVRMPITDITYTPAKVLSAVPLGCQGRLRMRMKGIS
jgi:hypothetical protein